MGFWDIFKKKEKVMPVSINDENFHQEVRKADLPVVLDIWSPECRPCKNLEPIIITLATKYSGRIKVAELNAAESQKTAAKLGVRGTPTVIFFNKGREIERVVGFKGQLYFEDVIEEDLLKTDNVA